MDELLKMLTTGCPDAIALFKFLFQADVELTNAQVMVSDRFKKCTKQPCHLDSLFFGSLSLLIYLTKNQSPLMTYFLDDQMMGPDVINSQFSSEYLRGIDYGTTPLTNKRLKNAVIERFRCVLEAENGSTFMNSFKQPLFMENVDEPLDEDSYRICIFRPDHVHYGPPAGENVTNETERKNLFINMKPEGSVEKTKIEVQFHPTNLIRLVGSVLRTNGKNKITQDTIYETYRDYLPNEILTRLEQSEI
jgi:hypothetical protein